MFRFFFPHIFITFLLTSVGAGGIEPFTSHPPVDTERPDDQVVHGGSWLAFRSDETTIQVAAHDDGQVMQTIHQPADDAPVDGRPGYLRRISSFGRMLAAEGDRLAILCDATVTSDDFRDVEPGITVFVWDTFNGTLVGTVDIETRHTGTRFVGLAAGRMAVSDPERRQLRVWLSNNMDELPPVTIPQGLPLPTDVWSAGTQPASMAGNHLVYLPPFPDASPAAVVVNLETGSATPLSWPADCSRRGTTSRLGLSRHHLVLPCTQAGTEPRPALLHYSLETSEVVARSEIGDQVHPGTSMRAVVADDGRWHATLISPGGTYDWISGSSAGEPFDTFVHVGSFGLGVEPPYAFVNDDVWLGASSLTLPGILSFRMKGGAHPDTVLVGEPLPANESDGVLRTVISLSAPSAGPVSFRLSTRDGSATSATDYAALDQTFVIPAGETEVTIEIPLTRDEHLERNETIVFQITDASPNAMVLEPEFVGVIGGSSFNLLAPVSPWTDDTGTVPTWVALSGDKLVQANHRPLSSGSTSPAVLSRPFDGGDWTASANWARPIPVEALKIEFFDNHAGRVLMRERAAVSVFDPTSDDVIFRINSSDPFSSIRRTDAFCSEFLLSEFPSKVATEYQLNPPFSPRVPEGRSLDHDAAAYSRDCLIVSEHNGLLRKYAKSDGTDQGIIFSGGPWEDSSTLAADGDFLAIAAYGRRWVSDLTKSRDIKELAARSGYLSGSNGVEIEDGQVFVSNISGQNLGIHIFEASTGAEIDVLLGDLSANLLPGALDHSTSEDPPEIELAAFSVEGSRAVASFDRDGLQIARFSVSEHFPSLVRPAPLREGDQGTLQIRLTEAVSWPISITTRVVIAGSNQESDWTGSGSTVVVPPGQTSFDTGIRLVDDHSPEDPMVVPLEFSLTGNGATEVRRLSLDVADNDVIDSSEVPMTELTGSGPVFAALGGGWAYQTFLEDERAIGWTEDESFTQTSPLGTIGAPTFAVAMAGSNGWLAVTQDNHGPKTGVERPSSIQVYRPGDQHSPLYFIKGKKFTSRFGEVLFAKGDFLFVGSPAIAPPGSRKTPSGTVDIYDLPRGKKVRTVKPPKKSGESFGKAIAANERSVWIAAPLLDGAAGKVFQFPLKKGKLERTFSDPSPGPGRRFGHAMVATDELVIISSSPGSGPAPISPGAIHAFDTIDGSLVWTIPIDTARGTAESPLLLVDDGLLAVGGESIAFYELAGGTPPDLLVELKGVGADAMQSNGSRLLLFSEATPAAAFEIDLGGIPNLAVRTLNQVPFEKAQPLILSKTLNGWVLELPNQFSNAGLLTLEMSSGLGPWENVATKTTAGAWTLTSQSMLRGFTLVDELNLQMPSETSSQFFRLRAE